MIPGGIGRYRAVSGGIRRHQAVSGGLGWYRAVSGGIGRYRAVSEDDDEDDDDDDDDNDLKGLVRFLRAHTHKGFHMSGLFCARSRRSGHHAPPAQS